MTGILVGLLAVFLITLVSVAVGFNYYLNTRPYSGPRADRDSATGQYLVTPMFNFATQAPSVPLFNFVPTPRQIPLHNPVVGRMSQ